MKRVIKFRVWDHLEKEMLFPDTITPGVIHLQQAELMQFSGLFDKKDVEIYEGDVLQSFSGKYLVSFNNGCFSVVDKGRHFSLFTCPKEEIEVIGNVFESPDLLK